MTEEQKEQPKPQPATEIVKALKWAHELALLASGYKATMEIKSRDTKVFVENRAEQNAVLAEYILRAERNYIADHSAEILTDAIVLLERDLDEIKEVVNG